MILELRRVLLLERRTVGVLFVDGVFECFTCEDRVRGPTEPKIFGETAVPVGRYAVNMRTISPKFGRIFPRLESVPGFSGVLIHPGNTEKDTLGCVLVGRVARSTGVEESWAAFRPLFEKLEAADAALDAISLEVSNP